MNSNQWDQIQTLFKELVDLDPDSRDKRLESVKTKSPLLYDELQSLLVTDSEQTSHLDGYAIEQVNLLARISADGQRVAFRSGRDGNSEIYVVDADGTNLTNLSNNGAFDGGPSISGN